MMFLPKQNPVLAPQQPLTEFLGPQAPNNHGWRWDKLNWGHWDHCHGHWGFCAWTLYPEGKDTHPTPGIN